MMNKPMVSIIMGIYNCGNMLRESIESILNQSYGNWELIMCDDCSKDNTLKIAKEYEEKYPDKIKVIENKENLTLGPTLNRCLKIANGKYIARQDGDDLSLATRLEEEIAFLENNPEFDLVGTNMISFDEHGEKGYHIMKEIPVKDDYLKKGVTFAHATIVMKTRVMKSLGGYCEDWYAKQAEDYELWSRFFEEGYRGYNLQKKLYYVREDSNAYKRRSSRRRLRGMYLNMKIYPRIKAPFYCYKKILKDFIAIFIPSKVFGYYYKLKLKQE